MEGVRTDHLLFSQAHDYHVYSFHFVSGNFKYLDSAALLLQYDKLKTGWLNQTSAIGGSAIQSYFHLQAV